MALIMDGVTIPELGGAITMDGVAVDTVIMDGVEVWKKYLGPVSPIIVTTSTTLVAGVDFPAGIAVSLCMVGGGGGGAVVGHDNYSGGGTAGAVITSSYTASQGESVVVTIGGGGAGAHCAGLLTRDLATCGDCSDGSQDPSIRSGCWSGGSGGSDTSFATVSAAGGAGGRVGGAYTGNGGSRTTCGGTGTDGHIGSDHTSTQYGGQSSGFGNGGNGNWNGGGGGVGSGGGGATNDDGGATNGGVGGRGQVNISW